MFALEKTDYGKVGLKVGLEIHQQLDTETKLFCNCGTKLFKEEPQITFLRRLRPTQSELGQIDPAAYFEFQKGVRIRYEANRETSCLVEMDEEPPHKLNEEAVQTVLTVATMLNAKPVDEIHVMRKTVIDGSNTTGFQRTCVIALKGELKVNQKTIPIEHLSLEEDAARKTGEEEGNIIRYRIDRLGMPLIEIATAPVIKSAKEAEEVALAIGRTLRTTGKVKRGLGTIRQDINISIPKGALIEIKGVQELELISLSVEYEVRRQLNLIRISETLQQRGVKGKDIDETFIDVTEIFRQTKCKVIRNAVDRNLVVLAIRLPKFGGLLKWELVPNFRLGTEMSDRAKFWGRVGGIFHTDEMPAYGITSEEVKKLIQFAKAEESDAVVFVADSAENAQDALEAVVERAREAIVGVPEETRAANPDGTTHFMRPRPGAARMYPETDIPPMVISDEFLGKIKAQLPEPLPLKFQRLVKEYALNEKLAKQLLDSEYFELFETSVRESGVSPTVVVAFLTETLKALKREGVEVEGVRDELIKEIFKGVGSGKLAKEAVSDVFAWLAKHEDKTVEEAIASLGFKAFSEKELEEIIDTVITNNQTMIHKLGKNAFGAVMGMVMKEVRGRANAVLVGELLRKKLDSLV